MRKLRIVSILILALFLICACNSLRGPVVAEKDDGQILAIVVANRGIYKEGETVEVTFTIKNISNEPLLLEREDALVQDLWLSSYPVERYWSDETGEGFHELYLEPGESSTIEWQIKDLEMGFYTYGGVWWSAGVREVEVYVFTEYGPARY